jgi:hypothetical protein
VAVAVMNARKAMRPTKLGNLGKAVGKVAKRNAGCDGDQAECRNRDARACAEAVQQEHESSDRYGRDCE